jgi:hypothetical protein
MPYMKILKLSDGFWHIPDANRGGRTNCDLYITPENIQDSMILGQVPSVRKQPTKNQVCDICFNFQREGF